MVVVLRRIPTFAVSLRERAIFKLYNSFQMFVLSPSATNCTELSTSARNNGRSVFLKHLKCLRRSTRTVTYFADITMTIYSYCVSRRMSRRKCVRLLYTCMSFPENWRKLPKRRIRQSFRTFFKKKKNIFDKHFILSIARCFQVVSPTYKFVEEIAKKQHLDLNKIDCCYFYID